MSAGHSSPPVVAIPEILERETRFTCKKFAVEHRRMRLSNGHEVGRDIVLHPGAVVLLPLLDESRIVMVRNSRPAVGEVLLELPAGTREPNEEPQATAARELIEETGYRADRVELLSTFYTSPGILSEKMYAYLATGLTPVGLDLEEDEILTPQVVELSEALKMCADGRIRDGKTLACLMAYLSRAGRVR